jgi:hypothetical protein
VSGKDFLSFLHHIQDMIKKRNSAGSEWNVEETPSKEDEFGGRDGGRWRNEVESDSKLHRTKKAQSGEGKLLMALVLYFIFLSVLFHH